MNLAIALTLLSLSSTMKTVPLDASIEKQLWTTNEPPIATITWFDGALDNGRASSVDVDELVTTLEERARAIQGQNPWLTGRIINPSIWGGGPPILEYEEEESTKLKNQEERSNIVARVPKTIPMDTPPSDIYPLISSCVEIDTNAGGLWRVSVFTPTSSEGDASVAVVVAISHVVVDGYAYYRILEMLFSQRQYPLDMRSVSEDTKALIYGKEQHHFLYSSSFILKGLYGMIKQKVWGHAVEELWFTINQEQLDTEKKKWSSGDGSFVSTNDVLVSYFFRETQRATGALIVNLRTMLPPEENVEQPLGRNHWGVIYYQPQDYSDPQLIRQSVQRTIPPPKPPSHLDFILGDLVAFSSLRGLAKPAQWTLGEHVEMKSHLPVDKLAQAVPSGFLLVRPFQRNPQETVVRIIGERRLVTPFVEASPMLKAFRPGSQSSSRQNES